MQKARHFFNQTPLYEGNYALLMELAPVISNDIGINRLTLHHPNGPVMEISVVERHKFTSVVRITTRLSEHTQVFSNPVLLVRAYHDVQVAEVIGYQAFTRFEADYPYPNEQMLQPDEKRQVNQLLNELLGNYQGHRIHTRTFIDNTL